MYCDLPEFGRCCFCMPLRKGVLVFGYINLFFSAFLVGLHSYGVHYQKNVFSVYHGITTSVPTELSIALYCLEIILTSFLIYGAHKRIISYMKWFYYFTVTTTVAAILIQILEFTSYRSFGFIIEVCLFSASGLFIQIYLILHVRSLIKKLEMDGPHLYDNPLHQIVTGEAKIESNGIYNNTTVEPNTV